MPSFSRQHFKLIAETVAKIRYGDIRAQVAESFASDLAQTNPRFNRTRFMRACGVT